MQYHNETSLTPSQVHLIRMLLDGKREISEQEALIRTKRLGLREILFPCVVICVSPYYTDVAFEKKDETIRGCADYVSAFFQRANYKYYCLINSYDNIQVLLPTDANSLTEWDLDELSISLHQKLYRHFQLNLFIGIGSVVDRYADISRSATEAMEMLAYKYQYADRGVINIINTLRFKHYDYALYGQNIMFDRVIGRFQDGDLGMMAVRLNELIESIRRRPGVSNSAIKRTFIELAVYILHIASNANVDVDAILGDLEVYNWVLKQNNTDDLSEWLLDISAELLDQMGKRQDVEEKQIITQACDYISEHLDDPNLGLQTVSDAVGLSGAYFSQLFKKEKGAGLNRYINERRIIEAQKLLVSTELKSEEIALRIGFTTATYFGRVFKKSVGMTPKEYRKQARQTIEENGVKK